MSRRRNRNELTTIYWRDIPAQVTAQMGATREQALMPERFQVAIDRAAAVAGLTSTDDYVNEWRKVSQPLASEDAAAEAQHRADALTAEYAEDRLEALVWSGGAEQDAEDQDATVQNAAAQTETPTAPSPDEVET